MGLWQNIRNATDQELNSEVWGVRFDFIENRNQAVNTYNYCIKDIRRMYKLYMDMGNTGHNVFEDAIRFKIIKLTECFKYLSLIIRIKFYSNIKNNDVAFDTINNDILNNNQIQRLHEIINGRNGTAHERDAYECYMFEQEMENIKNDINDLTDIFNAFILEYERLQGIQFIDKGWK